MQEASGGEVNKMFWVTNRQSFNTAASGTMATVSGDTKPNN